MENMQGHDVCRLLRRGLGRKGAKKAPGYVLQFPVGRKLWLHKHQFWLMPRRFGRRRSDYRTVLLWLLLTWQGFLFHGALLCGYLIIPALCQAGRGQHRRRRADTSRLHERLLRAWILPRPGPGPSPSYAHAGPLLLCGRQSGWQPDIPSGTMYSIGPGLAAGRRAETAEDENIVNDRLISPAVPGGPSPADCRRMAAVARR
jgi:hypothetical protein